MTHAAQTMCCLLGSVPLPQGHQLYQSALSSHLPLPSHILQKAIQPPGFPNHHGAATQRLQSLRIGGRFVALMLTGQCTAPSLPCTTRKVGIPEFSILRGINGGIIGSWSSIDMQASFQPSARLLGAEPHAATGMRAGNGFRADRSIPTYLWAKSASPVRGWPIVTSTSRCSCTSRLFV